MKTSLNNNLPCPDLSYGKHDWTFKGYTNGIVPLVRHGFVAVIIDDTVKGRWFKDVLQSTHGDIEGDIHSIRFRYLPYYKNGTLVWTDVADASLKNIEIAVSYIKSKGWPLHGKNNATVEIIDKLMDLKYGLTPCYDPSDVPLVRKR